MFFLWIAVSACAGSSKPPSTAKTDVPSAPPVQQPSANPFDKPAVALPQTPSDPAQPRVETGVPAIHFTIQVGAFSTSGRAANQAARLQDAGLDAYFFVDSDGLHKVRFERFDTWEAARDRAVDLQSKRVIESFLIAHPGPDLLLDTQSALRESIMQTVSRFIGMPYRWGGASQENGFDCSGLTMTVYRLNGLELPRSALEQYQAGTPVARDALEPGDLVFFATGRGGRISHVGIYSGQDRFVHAPGRGKEIRFTSLSNRYFNQRYKGARRFLEPAIKQAEGG